MTGSDIDDLMNVFFSCSFRMLRAQLVHDPSFMLTGFLPNTHQTGVDVTHASVL